MTSQSTPPGLENRRLAFVQSSWHESLVERCRNSFVHELSELGISEGRVEAFRVPGALEIPLLAKRAMQSGRLTLWSRLPLLSTVGCSDARTDGERRPGDLSCAHRTTFTITKLTSTSSASIYPRRAQRQPALVWGLSQRWTS